MPGLQKIEHIVVVMFENRSFDNLLGWLYADSDNRPAANLPVQVPPTFDGLEAKTYFNQLDAPGSPPVFATHPPKSWPPVCPQARQVPTPDPHEEFDYVTKQLFGRTAPTPGTVPDMSGFLQSYATTAAGPACAGQIMESYGPAEASVINSLARNFAVCDRWFSSAPTETWPNRGFVHTGSSDGHINNEDYEPYGNRTLFNALSEQDEKSWGVFHDTDYVPALTQIQFAQLWDKLDHFHKFAEFKRRCAARGAGDPANRLPAYSFLEPRFLPEPGPWWRLFWPFFPNDYHPPHDVRRGERFLSKVYNAVRSSPYRDKILLVITFDEHGGCYDHVAPPWGSVAPQPGPVATKNGFKFDRLGVRVPTIVVSSYVTPGTVFRAGPGEPPYDHTSIVATLKNWRKLPDDPARFLASPRIGSAPTLDRVLTRTESDKIKIWPKIRAPFRLPWRDRSKATPLSGLQQGLLAHMKHRRSPSGPTLAQHLAETRRTTTTYAHALAYLKEQAKQAPTGERIR
jgi:phospholipase C